MIIYIYRCDHCGGEMSKEDVMASGEWRFVGPTLGPGPKHYCPKAACRKVANDAASEERSRRGAR